MTRPRNPQPEVRGARDLVALWDLLPVAEAIFPLEALPPATGTLSISNRLRADAWREHCARAGGEPCIERSQPCQRAQSCVADQLFPVHPGGGAPQWRMSTLFARWRPRARALRILAVGRTAVRALDWASAIVQERLRTGPPQAGAARWFGDLVPARPGRWRLEMVTPWLVGKSREHEVTAAERAPDPEAVAALLSETLTVRALKISALCSTDAVRQRLYGHLSRYVSQAVLERHVVLRRAELVATTIPAEALGDGKPYAGHAWAGWIELGVDEAALPWIALASAFGLGENADKGFGQAELVPVED